MIEANAATDLRIAGICGIPCEAEYLSIKGGHGHTRCLRKNTRVVFSPTTDMRHAMKAAKAVGLFDPAKGAAKLERVPLPEDEISWCLEFFIGGVGWTIFGPTPELAICEAILATVEENSEKTD